MKKRLLILLLLTALGCTMFSVASAAAPLEAEGSLTLHYQKEGQGFAQLSIGIYQVAEAFDDGTFELIEPFASYPVNIHGITDQSQWTQVAQTLYAYMVAGQVAPDQEAVTDAEGTVCFTGLPTGLYFVREAVAEGTDGTYVFNQFLIYLPTPQTEDYDVVANPKCTDFVPRTQYTVTKLWQDAGSQAVRPKEITVDIYNDGVLLETQVLNADNNWSYTWYVSGEDNGKWTVAERNVPEGYKVTLKQKGNTFSLINTGKKPPELPQTGDTFSPLPYVMIMCVAGMLLLILGLYGRRNRQ